MSASREAEAESRLTSCVGPGRGVTSVLHRQFRGFAGESEYRAEASRLTRTLGETAPYQRKQYFCCSYDPPLKPYGRCNEVWFLQDEP